MNLRQQSKQKTREHILNETALLLREVGFLDLSANMIARSSKVSPGTVFLHFGTKENLLRIVLDNIISSLENELKTRCKISSSTHIFLKNYLEVIIEYENILSSLSRDFFYLPESVRKKITIYETLTKNMFFENLQKKGKKKISIVDAFVAIDGFYSQIQRYLVEKNEDNTGSIIKDKKGRLLKLYRILFE